MPEPKITPSPLPPDYVDADAMKVVRRLRAHGYAAYLVGGGVRDLLLDAHPKDFDVATSARPEEVRATFRNCRLIGRRFRLAHIHFRDGKVIEVSTFRRTPQDVEQGDDLMIRDDNVFGTEAEDAMRRDFTMNALFYDVEHQTIIDYVGGVADLEARRLRTIGDPVVRFREDPVRILRGVKFAARLGLSLDPEVAEAAEQVAPDILRCSPPRILEELLRMLRSGHAARAFALLSGHGVLEVILPDIARLYDDEESAAPSEDAPPRLRQSLAELDRINRERDQPLPDAVLLAALYLGPVERAEAAARQQGRRLDPQALLAHVAGPALERLSVPRRLRDRFSRILAVQGRLSNRRRRGRPEALARRDFFADAVALLGIASRARGLADAEDFAYWSRYLAGARPAAAEDEAEGAAQGPERPEKRRRRRRRRRRGPRQSAPEQVG